MPDPFDAGLLGALLKTLRRHDWTDTGYLLDHMAERGTVVLTAGPKTDGKWGCAWTTAERGTLRVIDDNPHVAVRQVADVAVAGAVGAPRPRNPEPNTAAAAVAIAQGKLL